MARKSIDQIEREYLDALDRGEKLVPVTVQDLKRAIAERQLRQIRKLRRPRPRKIVILNPF